MRCPFCLGASSVSPGAACGSLWLLTSAPAPLSPQISTRLHSNMCSDNPNLPKEANKAKCFVVSCFVLCAAVARPPPGHGSSC